MAKEISFAYLTFKAIFSKQFLKIAIPLEMFTVELQTMSTKKKFIVFNSIPTS